VQVHGFGEGRPAALRKYPWTSTDSRTWLYRAQRNGGIRLTDRTYISFRADEVSPKTAPDIEALGEADRAVLGDILAAVGINWNWQDRGTHPGYEARTYLTCCYYMALERALNVNRVSQFRLDGLHHYTAKRKAIKLPSFRLYLAQGGQGSGETAQVAFTQAGGTNVLVSYAFLGNKAEFRKWVYKPMDEIAKNPRLATCNAYLQQVLGAPA
jgi:hypothetical protein